MPRRTKFMRTVLFVLLSAVSSRAQMPLTPGTVVSEETLSNGLRITTSNGFIEQITALRADVLRVRIAHGKMLPEDASWAVLSEARAAYAPVRHAKGDGDADPGFITGLLQVSVDRADSRITIRDAAGHIIEQDAMPIVVTGNAFRVTKAMPDDEHYFGLGDKAGPSDRRGHAFTNWNTDAYRFQESTDPLYRTIPYFVSFRAGVSVGTLLDNTWRSSFDFGKESATSYSFSAVDGPCDYYVFLGPTPREVVKTYAWLTGKPPLPPKWMLGFQQSRFTYTPQSRLLEIGRRLREDHIPADALYLDIGFQDRNRPFSVDTKAFSDLSGTLDELKTMHFHTVAIADLHIANAPHQNYAPYDSGMAADRFLHRADGTVYSGSVWPGPAVFPDFTQASARAWWGTLFTPFHREGFEGFWNDMNEPSIFNSANGTMPDDVRHRIEEPGFAPRIATHAEIHNVYGMENSRASYEGLLALDPSHRPFVLTRASYAGGQRYAATWTGDNSSTWNHLRLSTPMLKSLGISGFSFVGDDVGGFAGSSTTDLLTKWTEIAAFQPIDRDHSEKGTADQEPWAGGREVEDIRRAFIETRYRLMPYLYTLAEETSRTGLPMMRPLFLDYPNAAKDSHPLDLEVDYEFLLGHDLLVAPSPYPEAPDAYDVEFPTTRWYDFWTGDLVQPPPPGSVDLFAPRSGADLIPLQAKVLPELNKLPVYVRGGAIVPIAPLTQSTDESPDGPLTLRVYAGDDCRGELYDDDGNSFAYRKGQSLRMTFRCTVSSEKMTIELSKHEGSYPAWWKQVRVEVYGWLGRKAVTAFDAKGRTFRVQETERHLDMLIADDGTGDTLTIQ